MRGVLCSCALAAAMLLSTVGGLAQTTTASPAPSGDTLYKQLGGYDAIAAVTDDFIGRLATDKRLSKFFAGVSDEHKARIRQRVVDLLCQKTGGPCIYTGQDMPTVHTGLHISEADWSAAVDDFGQTMKKFNVPADKVQQLAALLNELKPQIVGK